MTFMRSSSGIRNYALFHGVNITVYIEGRCAVDGGPDNLNEQRTFDEIFYSTILKKTHPKLAFIIKPLGSKGNVLAYAQEICIKNIQNSFVIVDKDHENIISSVLEHPKIVRTFGYSWENDFWTRRLCLTVINDLALRQKNQNLDGFYRQYSRFEHRLTRMSKVDLLAKCHGIKYIPSTEKSVGVNIRATHFGVTFKSIRTFKTNIRNSNKNFSSCFVTGSISKRLAGLASSHIIRGHLWEHACLNLISSNYKSLTKETSIPHALIKRISFNKFSESPKGNFNTDTYKHYKKFLNDAVEASKMK